MATIAKPAMNGAVHDITSPSGARDPLKVLILSDVRVAREGLALLLARGGSVIVVGTGPGNASAAHIAEHRPNIVLLDATLDDMHGCAKRVRDAAAGIIIVAFALAEVDRGLIACAEAGISAFVGREGSDKDLLRVIDEAWRGEFSIPPHQLTLLIGRVAELAEMRSRLPNNLTRREHEILPLIERGLSNKAIARQLSIETTTIKNHVHNILEKMQLRSRGEIATRVRAGQAPSRPANWRS